tara:strand:+ start:3253 stop:4389 length:1137 start_codon:yes stop_codon:yes gene_type:complete
MKKILFISTRNPFSGRYSGDVIKSLEIIELLRKKFHIEVICLKEKRVKIREKNIIYFNYPNLFVQFFYCLISFFKFQPIQFGLFFSKEMKNYIENYCDNYDYLFFYHIRSSQYLPKNYHGKTILEMGDLYSDNYYQTFKYLSFLNPLKYIYRLEGLLTKNIESKIFSNFDRIVLFSKSEVNRAKVKFEKKIFQINLSIKKLNKKYSFSKNNFRILFVGNLNYLPNFLACRDFIKNIAPQLNKKIPDVKFCLIGNINLLYKFFLPKKNNVEILGPKKNLTPFIKSSLCGLANLKVATGVQGKVLNYMSYGLPVICSNKVSHNFGKYVLSFKKNSELVDKIILLKKNRLKSNQFSKKSVQLAKKLNWSKVGQDYFKLVDF